MHRSAASPLSFVRRYGTALALAALATTSLFVAAPAEAGRRLKDIQVVYGCSHDGYQAVGRSDLDDNLAGNLRYWEFDPVTKLGTTTNCPVAGALAETSTSGVRMAKAGTGLVYFSAGESGDPLIAYAWDVAAGTVTPIGALTIGCLSDDGSIAYAIGTDSLPYRIEKLESLYTTSPLASSFEAGAFCDLYGCSADGEILYGNVLDPTSVEPGPHLFVHYANFSITNYEAYSGANAFLGGGAVSPDGSRAMFAAADNDENPTLVFADSENLVIADRPQPATGEFYPFEIDGSGNAFGNLSTPDGNLPAYYDRIEDEIFEIPLPVGTGGGVAFGAAFPEAVICYASETISPDLNAYTYFRYTLDGGASELLTDVFEEPDIEFVDACSTDGTRCYAAVKGKTEVRFLVEGEVFNETGPKVQSATIAADGETLTLAFDENATHVAPPTLDLTEGPVGATYQSGNGTKKLVYTLEFVVAEHETGTYTLPAGAVEDVFANVNTAKTANVLNNSAIDLLAPTVESASISASGRTLTLVFSESVIDVAPPTLDLSGGAVSASYESGNNTGALKYALSRKIGKGETGTFDLDSVSVVDAGGGNPNAPATGPIDNDSTFVPDVKPPTVKSAKINAAGDTLTIVYSENVDHEKDATLALSGGKIAVDYESGDGSKAIAYSLSRLVRKGETGTYALVLGAVVDTSGNKIVAVSAKVTNDSKVPPEDDDGDGDGDGDPPPAKTEKRPNGATANSMIDVAFQQAYGIFGGAYTDNGYYAFLFAYYSVVYRYECGDSFKYGGEGGPTRDGALKAYKADRYNQLLYAYYAQYYAYHEYSTTGSSASLYTFLYAYYSYLYAVEDLNAK